MVGIGIICFIAGVGVGAILVSALNSDKKDRSNCKCKVNKN